MRRVGSRGWWVGRLAARHMAGAWTTGWQPEGAQPRGAPKPLMYMCMCMCMYMHRADGSTEAVDVHVHVHVHAHAYSRGEHRGP